MKRILIYLVLTILLTSLIGCKSKKNGKIGTVEVAIAVEEEAIFPNLEGGEFVYSGDNIFGGTKEIAGVQIYDDEDNPVHTGVTKVIVKDGYLAMMNRRTPVQMFRFNPELEFVNEGGVMGRGPGEMTYPDIVPSVDKSAVCYIYDYPTESLYKYGFDGSVSQIRSPFEKKVDEKNNYRGVDMINIGEGDFIYVANVSGGKAIFRATIDSTGTVNDREIYNLRADNNLKTWTAYIGDLGVNVRKDRVVYAYKYYKMLRFMDMEAQTIRTIRFEDAKGYNNSIGMDGNVTHYWGMTYNDDYLYVYYSGRTPVEVGRDNNKGNYYCCVEQYDWNGNPIARYKLDNWGSIGVDSAGNLYLVSFVKDGPFYRYELSPIQNKKDSY